ncbi:hypothetical protein NKH18_45220 [Streptomyces sp. M10(2022)]
MPADDRAWELSLLSSADRERLASDPVLVDALRAALPGPEFAVTAAGLMVQVPAGVDQPVSAGREVRARIATMLHDPQVAATLLKDGSRVVVVPKDEAMTSLDAFRHLRGVAIADGRTWDTTRGAGGKTAAVTEENLLGEVTGLQGHNGYADGYSTTTHEFAHTIHQYGLSDADRRIITAAYQAKKALGTSVQWPDGYRLVDPKDPEGELIDNYSSTNEYEYFAQATNAYLGTNFGNDRTTGQPGTTNPAG